MTTKQVVVTQRVSVSVDLSKFTPEFMEEFRRSYYNFVLLDEHIEHLAQLYARGIVDNTSFIEGYGRAADMGIVFTDISQEEEVVS